ncbi:MarR family winged helix-turn-helix transcriptional regulator [Granulicella tundricola]|uniref:Regulatory protein MarR n=1 Tax=Granulicella tundricola (strain ATCC BAA-1859 / DSM 23138 / MP5ACTX9) TaxID=1198114 RepID=E8X313_GRATM|nr:MarR family transcriptional regulator [Granulicella tundricola]ADW68147.1 regulatory protein MarR [Granulicella tundricola MP5ACTX9]
MSSKAPGKAFDRDIAEFTQSIGLLVRRSRAAAASHELSWTEARVLNRLAKDGPATTADLARVEGMRPQSMRPIIATLEQGGMIARQPHPTDGRQVNLVLTRKGEATQKSVREAKRTWITHAIAQLDKQDQQTLFAAGRIIERLLESNQP